MNECRKELRKEWMRKERMEAEDGSGSMRKEGKGKEKKEENIL